MIGHSDWLDKHGWDQVGKAQVSDEDVMGLAEQCLFLLDADQDCQIQDDSHQRQDHFYHDKEYPLTATCGLFFREERHSLQLFKQIHYVDVVAAVLSVMVSFDFRHG